MKTRRWGLPAVVVFGLAVGLAGLAPASGAFAAGGPSKAAAEAPVEQISVDRLPSCDPALEARQAADNALLQEVAAAAQARRYDGVRPLIPRIEAALAAAPAEPHLVEQCRGAVLVHTDDMGVLLLMTATVKPADGKGDLNIVQSPWPYPTLAVFAGATYVEDRAYERAAAMLLRGLEFAPNDPLLTSEAANALTMLHRYEDAVAICDRTLEGNLLLEPRDEARILRAKGYALGELGRFDEAIAAYKASLKAEPGNATAKNELKYLAARKKGAPATQTTMTSGGG